MGGSVVDLAHGHGAAASATHHGSGVSGARPRVPAVDNVTRAATVKPAGEPVPVVVNLTRNASAAFAAVSSGSASVRETGASQMFNVALAKAIARVESDLTALFTMLGFSRDQAQEMAHKAAVSLVQSVSPPAAFSVRYAEMTASKQSVTASAGGSIVTQQSVSLAMRSVELEVDGNTGSLSLTVTEVSLKATRTTGAAIGGLALGLLGGVLDMADVGAGLFVAPGRDGLRDSLAQAMADKDPFKQFGSTLLLRDYRPAAGEDSRSRLRFDLAVPLESGSAGGATTGQSSAGRADGGLGKVGEVLMDALV